VAAAIADKAIVENRAVGLTVNAHRTALLPADRGSRQHLKIMQLLAAVDGDGSTPLVETLLTTASRLRRGMTAIVITSSTDVTWIRPIGALRPRGIATVVVAVDGAAFDRVARTERERLGEQLPPLDPAVEEARAQRARALRHALAEYELRVHTVLPGQALGLALS
jgi:uncharacterized protein (DUF58 family)